MSTPPPSSEEANTLFPEPPPPPPPYPTASRKPMFLKACAIVLIVLTVLVFVDVFRQPPNNAPSAPSHSSSVQGIVNINGTLENGTIAGTGMVLTPSGLVLTNNHVVAGTVSLTGQVDAKGPTYTATVIGVDATHDVAVLQLTNAKNLPVMHFASNSTVQVGEQVDGLGNALGKNGSPVEAAGVITSLDETIAVSGDNGAVIETLSGLIGFNAHIQPGDSGGPLLNSQNEVIGMDTAASNNANPSSPSFGFAIPIAGAMPIAQNIIKGTPSAYIEGPHTGSLGVSVTDSPVGALVASVTPGSGASSAGIVPGDTLLSLNGQIVTNAQSFNAAMLNFTPGEKVNVTWTSSDAVERQASITLTPGPPA